MISGEVDAMSSSLSAFACASFGASMVASAEFPYLPIVSTTDVLAMPAATGAVIPSTASGISRYYDGCRQHQQRRGNGNGPPGPLMIALARRKAG
eukprot:COSAG02_NODE_1564_length_11912_cov_7.524676_6_plen_95_part_00